MMHYLGNGGGVCLKGEGIYGVICWILNIEGGEDWHKVVLIVRHLFGGET